MDAALELAQKVPQPVQYGLAGVGALFLTTKLFGFFRLLLSAFVLGGTNLRKYGKPGTWVVITGASDGLGKEYATQLAAKSFNLVLVSRTESKLEALAKELQQKYPKVQTKILAMDFAKNDDSDYERLKELVAGLDVGILINNVGQSHEMPVTFLETSATELHNIVTINCLGTLKVTQAIAPILKKRKNGLILTMGSTAGWSPSPLLATYSGSKAFLQHWSSALATELAEDNVDVQLVISHLVTTTMSKIRRPSLLVPNARNFVRSALGKVGLGGFQAASNTYTPWWSHAFLVWVVETIPGIYGSITLGQTKSMHKDIRRRALRKKEREAKKQ
ncbi:unnamed protein product [Clonostachys byssicola]|uniref:Very-long-chain 3-oxoacyl-CoA reductase n=1 Tax=Clonostachys byssicola TaxID=160290 RepID=A0A9N9U5C5_9HYPO|nr:unnamed protein product [Clonostachys byssicola]